MAPDPIGMSTLRPEDVTSDGLPTAMRGYEKERVDRLLARVADAYALTRKQSQGLLDRIESLEADLAAAQGEAAASARSVAELMRASSPATGQPAPARKELRELEARVQRAEDERERAVGDLRKETERASQLDARVQALERERDRALAELHEMSDYASELGSRLRAFETAPHPGGEHRHAGSRAGVEEPSAAEPVAADAESARVLLAATRAAEDVRAASRARALRTLLKARQRAMELEVRTEDARAALAEAEQRCHEVEREAQETLARTRLEADRAAAAIVAERRRVRELLADALASLGEGDATSTDDLVADLGARLSETSRPATSATNRTPS